MENNIKVDIKEIGCEVVGCIKVVQCRISYVDSCEQGNDSSRSINDREFFDQLKDYKRNTKDSEDCCLLGCSTVAIALMLEAARTSETLLNFYQTTRCYNPEDSNLHTHRRENLKPYEGFYSLKLVLYTFSCDTLFYHG
jgi:hypothetical protein